MPDGTRRTYRLGTYADRPYFLTVPAWPQERAGDVEEFAVSVHYDDPERGTSVEVARIDDAHDVVHVDKLYRRGQPKEELDVTLWEAEEYLIENWRRFAREYEKTHGD